MDRQSVRIFVRRYAQARTAKAAINLLSAARSLLHYHGHKTDAFDDLRIDAGKPLQAKGVWTDRLIDGGNH